MKNSLLIFSCFLWGISCAVRPKNFTYTYRGEKTGLGQRINLDGYYVSARGCDSTFYTVFRFYPDGLFAIATASELSPALIRCFGNESKDKACKYLLKGVYLLEGDWIKTQVVWPVGNGCTQFRNYRILPSGRIANSSDYVEAEYSNLAYIKNYPSFYENPCEQEAQFYPLLIINERK
ncbi:MAG: hypothetical protein FWF52_07145 [Candidatus Azobacteroides sp.]|nr:hypothetical protein [Candidatus Azobacteroides sp.]